MTYAPISFDQRCCQLIPSHFPPIDLYERLESSELRAAAQELERRTNPRLVALQHIEKLPKSSDQASHQYQNWNHAPFVYKNPEGTHFLGPGYGVVEMATELNAALVFALRRREEFFSRTNEEAMGQDMRVLYRHVTATLIDLTALSTALAQEERWKIGQGLWEDDATGIIYCRPGHGEHQFVSVFDGRVLGPAVQGEHYRFVWDGGTITSVYDFTTGETIHHDDLLTVSLRKNVA